MFFLKHPSPLINGTGKTSLYLSWIRTEILHRKKKKSWELSEIGKMNKKAGRKVFLTNIAKENQKNRAKEFTTGPKTCQHFSLWTPWRQQSEPQLVAETRQTFGLTWKSHPSAFVLSYGTLGTQPFYWENILQVSISDAIHRVLQSPQVFLVSLNVLPIQDLAFEVKMMAYTFMRHSLSGDRR